MTIVVNPHNPQEEQALLAFLDNMKYDYSREDETFILSEAQQNEILARDREYESGETETYSIDEIIAHFNIKEKIGYQLQVLRKAREDMQKSAEWYEEQQAGLGDRFLLN